MAKRFKKYTFVILLSFFLLFCQAGYAYIYSCVGYNDRGYKVHGALTALGFDGVTVQGFIYKANKEELYFKGKWVGKNKVEAYDDNGLFLSLTTYPLGIGSTEYERNINAHKYLINYFTKALKYVPNYVGLDGKINLAKDHYRAFFGDFNAKMRLYQYNTLITTIPVAATNYRIIKDMVSEKTSQERIKSFLGLNWSNNPDTAKYGLREMISYFKESMKTYDQVMKGDLKTVLAQTIHVKKKKKYDPLGFYGKATYPPVKDKNDPLGIR